MYSTKKLFLIACLLFITGALFSCNNQPKQEKLVSKTNDYIKTIPGKDDGISAPIAQKGEVLVGYSDCLSCHKEKDRSKGPAFMDIAKRYPVHQAYIEYLANKIISGGRGSWGYSVMTPHPGLSKEDAQMMATYILSLDQR